MSARRALVAVLLALFVALSPLLGDMPAGGGVRDRIAPEDEEK